MTKNLGRISKVKRSLDAIRIVVDAVNTLELETGQTNIPISDLYEEGKKLLKELERK